MPATTRPATSGSYRTAEPWPRRASLPRRLTTGGDCFFQYLLRWFSEVLDSRRGLLVEMGLLILPGARNDLAARVGELLGVLVDGRAAARFRRCAGPAIAERSTPTRLRNKRLENERTWLRLRLSSGFLVSRVASVPAHDFLKPDPLRDPALRNFATDPPDDARRIGGHVRNSLRQRELLSSEPKHACHCCVVGCDRRNHARAADRGESAQGLSGNRGSSGCACRLDLRFGLLAASAENAFNEFNRVSLFLGVFVLTALTARRYAIKWWCAGLEIAVALIALVALVSRFFPGTFPDQGLVALASQPPQFPARLLERTGDLPRARRSFAPSHRHLQPQTCDQRTRHRPHSGDRVCRVSRLFSRRRRRSAWSGSSRSLCSQTSVGAQDWRSSGPAWAPLPPSLS